MSAPSSPPSTPSRSYTSIPRTPHARPTSPLRPTSPPTGALRPTSPTPTRSSTMPVPSVAGMRRTSSSGPSSLSREVSLSGSASHANTPPPGTVERPKTRARDLLRKHYGLGPPPPMTGPAKGADPMDLDSTAFDARAYYEQLITTSSLPALLRRENELMSEIRELDSERQSLVYNHHHELIAASDTIAAMKSRAENLDADLDLLRVAFSEISRLSTEIAGRDS
ncbi:hypothetical protein WOLCODRAFT_89865 [Wolfiporia cocos MD-104 SS10]|uniref:Vacuolar protein sorting-associated protein 51 homolog n=1 Tax=Wolfiporia cocos (strain MD-104) TaxID=742152 RepID=A0A2H3JJY8_WOLCO|nr:hypothetical protein WOLCODRAFT_89865 [Wolfiporia cocos MD-104 SS10]